MAKKVAIEKHMWTKDEIKSLIRLWDDMTKQELADELGITPGQLMYMVHHLKKAGHTLPKKHNVGRLQNLAKEVLKELRLIK